MQDLTREYHVFADNDKIGEGCHMILTAENTPAVRPALHRLLIYDLSPSSAAVLSGTRNIYIVTRKSILAFGELVDVQTRFVSGRQQTDIMFSPGMMFWQSSVSLSLAPGMSVSDSIRSVLNASTGFVPLAAFTAEDKVLSRSQAFFGRTCDALSVLAETVDADIFFSASGICVSGRAFRTPSMIIPESCILSEPEITDSRILLSVSMLGWPLGAWTQFSWNGSVHTGRLVSGLIHADNLDSFWKSELELIPGP